MASNDGEAISPELVLVCPDLREAAIASLPDRDPDEKPDRSSRRAVGPEFRLMWSLEEREPVEERVVPLAVAVAVYTLSSAARFAVEAAALTALLVGLLSIVTVARL
ncbi:MAG TPA: hypothetical protein VHS03_15090 [Gaiellaceae bacterium]|jgi:hypothetical protein|nr:hypothetical protein [Gaiellaceae bacterium]